MTGQTFSPTDRESVQGLTFLTSKHLQHGRFCTGRAGILHRAWIGLRRRCWFLNLYKNIFVSEFRSLIPRTKYRMRKNLDTNGVDLGTGYREQPSGHLVANTRTQTRIRDMQQMLASFPEATLVDLALFLEGWDRGEESLSACPGNSCTEHLGHTLS